MKIYSNKKILVHDYVKKIEETFKLIEKQISEENLLVFLEKL